MNELKKILGLCFLLFLAACQSVQVSDSAHITEEEVVSALQKNGVHLVEEEPPQENVFGSNLKNVHPGAYELEGKLFFVYAFATENELEKGIEEFDGKTATMELVSSSMFIKRNILIFYVHEQDSNSDGAPFENEIQQALDGMIEG